MREMPSVTRFEPSKLETLHACPFCASLRLRYMFVERGFPYVQCEDCGLITLATRLREEHVGEIYDDEGYHTGTPSAATRRTAQKRVKLLGTLPAGAKIVEDGAGNGLFVAACRAAGYDATGCDLGRDAVAKAQEVAGVTLAHGTLESLRLPSNSLDAVASFNLLSHLYRPWEYIQEVQRVLKPGGVWLTRVGDKTGWKKLLSRGEWSAPEHVFHFPLALVRRMSEQAGLRQQFARPAFDSDFPFAISRLGRSLHGLPRQLVGQASQAVLLLWMALSLPRDDYYLRFVK